MNGLGISTISISIHFIVKLALIYNTAQRNVQRLGKQIKSTGLTFVAPGFITCITQINELLVLAVLIIQH